MRVPDDARGRILSDEQQMAANAAESALNAAMVDKDNPQAHRTSFDWNADRRDFVTNEITADLAKRQAANG
jgi:hypothetical protein